MNPRRIATEQSTPVCAERLDRVPRARVALLEHHLCQQRSVPANQKLHVHAVIVRLVCRLLGDQERGKPVVVLALDLARELASLRGDGGGGDVVEEKSDAVLRLGVRVLALLLWLRFVGEIASD